MSTESRILPRPLFVAQVPANVFQTFCKKKKLASWPAVLDYCSKSDYIDMISTDGELEVGLDMGMGPFGVNDDFSFAL
jgi:hypothetical protein